MDLQDKMLLTVSKFGKVEKKEINLSLVNNKTLFSIGEYDDASITNLSKNFDIYIEDIDDGENIKISSNETKKINFADHPYPAMIYQIKILNKNTNDIKIYSYEIVHSYTTNESQYQKMIMAIKEYDEYLLYDTDVKYLRGKKVYSAAYHNLYSIIENIIKNSSHIINNLITIYNNPVLIDKKIVVKSNILKKQSAQSIRKNFSSYKEDVMYSSKLVQVSDSQLNRYLLYLIEFSKKMLIDLMNKCHKEAEKITKRLKLINEKFSSNKSERIQYQIDSLNKKLDKLNNFLSISSNFVAEINHLKESNDFKNIMQSQIRDKSIIYYPNYLSIERNLFLPLFNNYSFSLSNSYSSILASPLKQTSKLFEAYCLLTLEAVINDLGFEIITDEIDYEHIIKRFAKDSYEIELMYEIDAKDVSVVEKCEVYYLFNNAKHITPDFYLILKDNGIPIKFMVFDAKSMPFRLSSTKLSG